MKNLDHDNAKHCHDFHRVCTAAILAYIQLDVVRPSPDLFLSDFDMYMGLVNHDGGTTMLQYLYNAGGPILRYKRSIRARRGSVLKHLVAYSIHTQRSLAHKSKSVLINLTCLAGLCCAHPKLQVVLENTFVVSLFGHVYTPFDHLLEMVNHMQVKRSTAFRGYDAQLHFTKYIKPLLHVDTAWKMADGGIDGTDDGIPSYLYNDIAELRRKLRANCGTDLTIQSGNSLWFTGNAVPLNGGDYRERMPWIWLWEVAFGRSAGKMRADPMHWRTYVTRFIRQFLFRR